MRLGPFARAMMTVTLADPDAILDAAPRVPVRSLPALDQSMDIDERLEIASESDKRGPLATIKGLLEALRVRHGDDDTTCAILAAVEHYHMPMLLDRAKG